MTNYQRAKRRAFWQGLAFAIFAFTGFIAALGVADRITG